MYIRVTGAHAHNLQSVELCLEHGLWHAVTGLSGSGKSSVVFDTLVREGQVRFLGALSPRARRVLGKLGPAEVESVSGLPAAIAVGQGRITRSPRSTVGTLTGTLDLLRLWFAREAAGQRLQRSDFGFNGPGACAACKGLGVEDLVDPALLVADASKGLRDGALVPTLANGYTVYSQVTLEVMDRICRAHGFDVDTPWNRLTAEQRNVVLHGTRALKVPFGKHGIASRLKWKGITAKPREEGYYRGLVPVIEETLARKRNPSILRFVRSVPCSACAGTRLGLLGRESRLGEVTLPQLLALPSGELDTALSALPDSAVARAVLPSLQARLDRLVQLDLGHLGLARSSMTLSAGEAQRVRLVSQLSTELCGVLVALDEPTLGLHPSARDAMARVLDEAVARGNTVVVVEHDPQLVRAADRLLALGPGGGPDGGRIVFTGRPQQHPLTGPPVRPRCRGPVTEVLRLTGARLHNLRGLTLELPLARLSVLRGPSGAGKSSLVFGCLLPALRGERGPYEALEGSVPAVQAVDATPIGRTPRSTPATWSGLFDLLRKRFARTPQAREAGFTASRFSFNTKAGRCPACEGLGTERIGLHLVTDVERTCTACQGRRFDAETLAVRWRGLDIHQVLELRAAQALERLGDDAELARLLAPLVQLGLGYLRLGQSSTTLSRGEAQRIKLAALLAVRGATPQVLLLDEPDRGLHPADVSRLLEALHQLVDQGHTVLAVSHHEAVWAAADHLLDLAAGDWTTATPVAERPWRAPRPPTPPPATIELTGVRTHNLSLDVSIPRGALTVVAGVSGSGKSSLVYGTLVAEARARFAESLPFEVRRHLRQLPRPALAAASGLSPTLSLRQGGTTLSARSTVGTQSTLDATLRLLYSRAGQHDGGPWSAEHFSPNRPLGACPFCDGLGTVPRCEPEALVVEPTLPLFGGALGSDRVGKHFGDPDGRYAATVAVAAPEVDWSLPWQALVEAAQEVALHGTGEVVHQVRWRYRRGKREGEHALQGPWEGLCALVEQEARVRARARAAAAWARPLRDQPCPHCGGERLAEGPREVTLWGLRPGELRALSLGELRALVSRDEAVANEVLAALVPALRQRIEQLCELGLAHLSLDRPVRTLSGGELQRLRLAAVLHSGLAHLTLALDEPAAGLHATQVDALIKRLRRLVVAGHTVVVVSHRPQLLRAADHLIELGVGGGPDGGCLVAAGPPERVLAGDSPTARALRQSMTPGVQRELGAVQLLGARLHNLADVDVSLPDRGLVVVAGVSGSGKSSLVYGVLLASARAGRAVGCRAVVGLDAFTTVEDGVGRGATVLSVLGLSSAVQSLFHGAQAEPVLPKRAFSTGSPAGRCAVCGGRGEQRVSMDFFADLHLACEACAGTGLRAQVRAVRWRGWDLGTFLGTPISALPLEDEVLEAGRDALRRLGLGHLALGRRTRELSGGERQRLGLARVMLRSSRRTLVVLDEPARGLHEQDVFSLVALLRELGEAGHLVVAVAHRRSLIAAADHVLTVGPGAGAEGGRLVPELSSRPAR